MKNGAFRNKRAHFFMHTFAFSFIATCHHEYYGCTQILAFFTAAGF